MTKDFIEFFQYGGLGGEKTTGQRLMRKFFFSLVLRKKDLSAVFVIYQALQLL